MIEYQREYNKRLPYPLDWDEQKLLFSELALHLRTMALFDVNTGFGTRSCAAWSGPGSNACRNSTPRRSSVVSSCCRVRSPRMAALGLPS